MQAHWENQLVSLAGKLPTRATGPYHSYWAGDISLQ
jgi:hypothetical protein